MYQGMSSRSARQRMGEHERDLDSGLVKSPLVMHAVTEHGGQKPRVLSVINKIEPKPLQRAARESILIASLPPGPENLNRCQEWGSHRVVINLDIEWSMTVPNHDPPPPPPPPTQGPRSFPPTIQPSIYRLIKKGVEGGRRKRRERGKKCLGKPKIWSNSDHLTKRLLRSI